MGIESYDFRSRECEMFLMRHGFKYIDSSGRLVILEIKSQICYKIAFDYKQDNINEAEAWNKIVQFPEISRYFSEITFINENILKVEYINFPQLDYYDKYNILDKVNFVINEVVDKCKIIIYDMRYDNILYNPLDNRFKIVDFADWKYV